MTVQPKENTPNELRRIERIDTKRNTGKRCSDCNEGDITILYKSLSTGFIKCRDCLQD